MTSPAPEQADWRNWALQQFDAPRDALHDTARAAFLATLERAEFVPPGTVKFAWHLFLRSSDARTPPTRALQAFRNCRAKELRDEVEQFAARYWSLQPGERQHEYQRLFAAAQIAPLARQRLQHLSKGLTIEAVRAEQPDSVQNLAMQIQELFILSSAARAIARQEFAESLGAKGLVKQLDLLQKRYPEIGSLCGDFKLRIVKPVKARSFRLLSNRLTERPGSASQVVLDVFKVLLGIGAAIVLVTMVTHERNPKAMRPRPSKPEIPITPWISLVVKTNPDGTESKTIVDMRGKPVSPDDLQLKVEQRRDGTKVVLVFDKQGNFLLANEATLKFLGSDKLLRE